MYVIDHHTPKLLNTTQQTTTCSSCSQVIGNFRHSARRWYSSHLHHCTATEHQGPHTNRHMPFHGSTSQIAYFAEFVFHFLILAFAEYEVLYLAHEGLLLVLLCV